MIKPWINCFYDSEEEVVVATVKVGEDSFRAVIPVGRFSSPEEAKDYAIRTLKWVAKIE